jgi:phage gpG-like protein
MQLKVELDDSQAQAALAKAQALLTNSQALWDAIGMAVHTNTAQRYEARTSGSGAAWAPLAPSTLQSYRYKYKAGIPGHLLERSGLMRNSLSHNATSQGVEVGFSVPYAAYHITGTKKMPRRDPLLATINASATEGTLAKEDQADILAIVNSMLGDALR